MYRDNNKMRVAAYARVSTDQEDQLHSLSAQISYFTDYINNNDNWELVEVYYDEGITGTSVKHREQFNRMIEDCENKKIDLILTKEVSRFARNTIDTLTYTRRLSELGIGVIFMNDGIDTRDKDGELRLSIMSSIAQEESRKISERVKWGVKRRMEKGDVIGCSRILGYKLIDGQLQIVPEEVELVKHIYHQYLYEGKGGSTIAADLNNEGKLTVNGRFWCAQTIFRLLKSEKYCGDLVQYKRYTENYLTKKIKYNHGEEPMYIIKDHHEAIISRDLCNSVQDELNRR